MEGKGRVESWKRRERKGGRKGGREGKERKWWEVGREEKDGKLKSKGRVERWKGRKRGKKGGRERSHLISLYLLQRRGEQPQQLPLPHLRL